MLNSLINTLASIVLAVQLLFGFHAATPTPAPVSVSTIATSTVATSTNQTTDVTASGNTVSSSASIIGSIDSSSLIATTPTPTLTGSSNANYVQLIGTFPADPLTGDTISSQIIPVVNGRWSFSVASNSYPGLGSTSLCNGVYDLQLNGIDGNTSFITASSTLENTTFTVNAPGNPNVCTPPTHL